MSAHSLPKLHCFSRDQKRRAQNTLRLYWGYLKLVRQVVAAIRRTAPFFRWRSMSSVGFVIDGRREEATSTYSSSSACEESISNSKMDNWSSSLWKSISYNPPNCAAWHSLTVAMPLIVSEGPLFCRTLSDAVKLMSSIRGKGEKTLTLLSLSDVMTWYLKMKAALFLKTGLSHA